jgi:phosphoethanolamine N-methyltransferase
LTAQYAEDFIDRLHLVWGRGFLSPGGPAEVAEIIRGLDLKDKLVLDIGCGTGGPAIVLARDMGARLVCIDVEPQLIERARRLASEAGVSDRIDFRMVDPGPLPFEGETFDVVFSKDALIHIPDKKALYIEILRVLQPGGAFAASDWLSGENARDDPAFQRFLDLAHLDFTMATAGETVRIMREVGFEDAETKDRNAWYAELSAQEAAAIEGPLREQIIEVSDRETYESWLIVRRQLAEATRSGGLRPTHLRGVRPS